MGLTIKNASGAKVIPASEYDQHLTAKPAVGHTTIVKTKNNPDGTKDKTTVLDIEEKVHPGIVVQTQKMGMLTVSGGSTVNLDNFEFARVDVSLSMPTTKEDLEDTFTFISEWVGNKIEQAVAQSKE